MVAPEQLPPAPAEKRCPRCRQIKLVTEFGRALATPDGLNCYCKQCVRSYARERYRRLHPAPPAKPTLAAHEKRCSSCREVKRRSEYGVSRSERDGLNWVCKECIRRQSIERYRRLHPHARPDIITAAERAEWRAQGRKRCARCKEVLTVQEFGPWSYSWDGLSPYCRVCTNQQNWERYHADLHGARQKARDAYWSDPEKYRQRKRTAHRLRPDLMRLRNATQYLKHRSQRRAYARAYRVLNRASVDAYQRDWRRRHPVKVRARNQAREARKRAAPGRWSAQDVALIHDAQRGRCAYCREELGAGYHVEHMTPLARGGSNWPWNLCVACETCNGRKHTLCAGAFLALLITESRG